MSLLTDDAPVVDDAIVDPVETPQDTPAPEDQPAADPAPEDTPAPEDAPESSDTPTEGDPESKTDDKPEDAPDEPEGEDSEGPPEKYDLGLSSDAPIDETLLGEATDIFRDIGLTNEQAQKVAALMPRAQELSQQSWQQQVNTWETESREKFGDNLDAVLGRGQRFVQEFGGPELATALESYGLGNHPAVIAALDNAMKAMGEDNTPPKPPGKRGSSDDVLKKRYPTMFPKDS